MTAINSVDDLQSRLRQWAIDSSLLEQATPRDKNVSEPMPPALKALDAKVKKASTEIIHGLKTIDEKRPDDLKKLTPESRRYIAGLVPQLPEQSVSELNRIMSKVLGHQDKWIDLRVTVESDKAKGTPLLTGPAMSGKAFFDYMMLRDKVGNISKTSLDSITEADETSRRADPVWGKVYGKIVDMVAKYENISGKGGMIEQYQAMAKDFGQKALADPANAQTYRALQKAALDISVNLKQNSFGIEMAAGEFSKGKSGQQFREILAHCLSNGQAKTALNDAQKQTLEGMGVQIKEGKDLFGGFFNQIGEDSPLGRVISSAFLPDDHIEGALLSSAAVQQMLGLSSFTLQTNPQTWEVMCLPLGDKVNEDTKLLDLDKPLQDAVDAERCNDPAFKADIDKLKTINLDNFIKDSDDKLTELKAKVTNVKDFTFEERLAAQDAIPGQEKLIENLKSLQTDLAKLKHSGNQETTGLNYIAEALAHSHGHCTRLTGDQLAFMDKLILGAGGRLKFLDKFQTFDIMGIIDIASALQSGGTDTDLNAIATKLLIKIPQTQTAQVDTDSVTNPSKADPSKADPNKAAAQTQQANKTAKANQPALTPAQRATEMRRLCSAKGLEVERLRAESNAEGFAGKLKGHKSMRKTEIGKAASVLDGALSTHFTEFPELVEARAYLKTSEVDSAVASLDKAIAKAEGAEDPKKHAGLIKDLKSMQESLSLVSDKAISGLEDLAKNYQDLKKDYKDLASAYEKPEGAELRRALDKDDDTACKIRDYFKDPNPAHLSGLNLSDNARALLDKHVAADGRSAAVMQQVQGFFGKTAVDLTNLLGTINAIQTGASFSPDQIKNYLANLANSGESGRNLAGMFETARFGQAKRRVASQMRYYEMMGLIHSGMPIEMVVMLFMMMMHEDYDERIRQKMEEVALAKQVEDHNRPIKEQLDYKNQNGGFTSPAEYEAAYNAAVVDPMRAGVSLKSSDMLNQELTQLMEQLKQIMNLLSNIMRAVDEMSMTPIRNMR